MVECDCITINYNHCTTSLFFVLFFHSHVMHFHYMPDSIIPDFPSWTSKRLIGNNSFLLIVTSLIFIVHVFSTHCPYNSIKLNNFLVYNFFSFIIFLYPKIKCNIHIVLFLISIIPLVLLLILSNKSFPSFKLFGPFFMYSGLL